MADSLILARSMELLGRVTSAIPACAGAIFSLQPGFDLSAPVPTASTVASLILDGERPVGDRASNRTPVLPIVIRVPVPNPTASALLAARATLAAAREVLARAVRQPQFELQWTRDGALPLVLDCYQASTVVRDYSLVMDQALVSTLTVTCSAAPYGRSDVPVVVDFQSPLAGRTAPPPPVTIDAYSTVTGAHWSQSLLGPGPHSAYYTTGDSGTGTTATYARSGIGPLNLTGLSALTVWAGFGTSGFFSQWGLRRGGAVQFAFTLTDGTVSRTVHVSRRISLSNNAVAPVWQKIRVPIPSGGALNLSTITGYTITVSNRQAGDLTYTDLYLDSLTAVPSSLPAVTQPTAGTVYDLAGVAGSARSAMSLQVQQPAGFTQPLTKLFTTPGAMAWLCPAGCSVLQAASVFGPGGRGSTDTGNLARAGAGGGEGSSEFGLPVAAGTVYTGNIGSGGSAGSGSGPDSAFTVGAVTITGHAAPNVASNSVTGGAGGTGYVPAENLTGQQGGFEGGIGTWLGAAGGNVTTTATGAQHHTGTGALQMSSAAAGDMIAASCQASLVLTQGEGCLAPYQVKINGWVRSAVSARAACVGAEFYDASANSLGQQFGATVTDSAAAWTQCTQATLTPPAGAVAYRALAKIVAAAAAAEVHYFDDMSGVSGQARAGGAGANPAPGSTSGGGGGVGGISAAGSAGSAGGAGGAAGTGAPAAGKGGKGGALPASRGTGGEPGGGGAGAYGSVIGITMPGGNGGDGGIALTFQQTAAFRTLVLHRPGYFAPDTLTPFVQIPVTDIPDGSNEYPVPSQVPGSNARFGAADIPSTYSVYLVSAGWNNPAASRVVSLTVNHYEQNGGTVYSQQISRTLTPSALASPLVLLGELTIPDRTMPDDNTAAFFAIVPSSINTADRFQDALFLDTLGSTVIIESPTAYVSYWIDEPVTAEIGNIMASQFDRSDAVSVLAYVTALSGPPLHVDPLGNQSLLAYAADAGAVAPSAQMTYFPRWVFDRLS